MRIYYKPQNAWLGDVIPYYDNDEFKLFYLHDFRNENGHPEGVPWYLIGTKDFIDYKEYGQAIEKGSNDKQDLFVFTGSIIKENDFYHAFYTGHNPHCEEVGNRQQGIMHAVSNDLITWTKLPEDTFFSSPDRYEPNDWRDPFVFWNNEEDEYWMLVTARLNIGPINRRGCTTLCVSTDLKKWDVREDIYSPGIYYSHECPDMFKIGDWWYLIISAGACTRYLMSKSPKGPWKSPEVDSFDGEGYYAAKSWSDGKNRYIFGWSGTAEKEKDHNVRQWGGSMIVHEIMQSLDGTLNVTVPQSIVEAFSEKKDMKFVNGFGVWTSTENKVSINSKNAFSCALSEYSLPDRFMLSMKVSFKNNTRSFGIMLRVDEDIEKAYYVNFEPLKNSMSFDTWPELERPVELDSETEYKINLFVEDSICVIYFDDKVALSARIYDIKEGHLGLFVKEGIAEFKDVILAEIPNKE